MVDAGAKPLVTITGVTGFIGSQVCLSFLDCGEFRVRGTVRDTKNEAKMAPLRRAFGEHFTKMEFVEADLLNAESIAQAVAGSTYVVHTASPVDFRLPTDEIVKIAVEGTMAVMKACSASGVKRCVVTSSMAAVCAMAQTDKPDIDTGFYDESCWSNPARPEGLMGYTKSKTLAEKAAWDYVQSLPEDQRFELVTICPTMVLGPTLLSEHFSSGMMVLGYMNGSKTECSPGEMGVVDVRDVAKQHLEAVRRPDAANQRFISYAERKKFIDIAQDLHDAFASKGFSVCNKLKEGVAEKDARVNN